MLFIKSALFLNSEEVRAGFPLSPSVVQVTGGFYLGICVAAPLAFGAFCRVERLRLLLAFQTSSPFEGCFLRLASVESPQRPSLLRPWSLH